MKVFLSDDHRRVLLASLDVYYNKLTSDLHVDIEELAKDLVLTEQQNIRMLIALLELK